VLDATSGLTIDRLRGGVTFGLPLVTPADAFKLRGKAYAPPGEKDAKTWKDEMVRQVAEQVRTGGTFNDVFNSAMIITAGADLYTSYTLKSVFRAEVDLTFDTTGKILINAQTVYGNHLEAQSYFFGDLSKIQEGTAQFLFLVDMPGGLKDENNNLKNPISSPPVFSVYGDVEFKGLSLPDQRDVDDRFAAKGTYPLSRSVFDRDELRVLTDAGAVVPTSLYTIDYNKNTISFTADHPVHVRYTTLTDQIVDRSSISASISQKKLAVTATGGEAFATTTINAPPAGHSVDGISLYQGSTSVTVPRGQYTFDRATLLVTILNRAAFVGVDWAQPVTADVSTSSRTMKLTRSLYSAKTVNVTLAGVPITEYTIDYGSNSLIYLGDNAGEIVVTYESLPVSASSAAFQIIIDGGASMDMSFGLFAKLEGRVILTFESTRFTAQVAANATVSYLGTVGTAGGTLVINNNHGTAEIWGALEFKSGAGLDKLRNLGIDMDGTALFKVNTTDVAQQVEVHFLKDGSVYPFKDADFEGNSRTISLKKSSFSVFIDASASFRVPGTTTKLFEVDGEFYLEIASDDADSDGTIDPGETWIDMVTTGTASLANNLLTYQIDGIMHLTGDAGLAARLKLTEQVATGKKISAIPSVDYTGSFGFYVNNTGEQQTIILPDDFTADIDGVFTNGAGERAVSISAGAPNFPVAFKGGDTLSYDNFTFAPAPYGQYYVVMGTGDVVVSEVFGLKGGFRFALNTTDSSADIEMEVRAKLDLALAGTTLFSFDVTGEGSFGTSGLVGVLTASLASGFTLSDKLDFDANYQLRLNSTSSAKTVAGISVAPGGGVHIDGKLHILFLDIKGQFDLTIQPEVFEVSMTGRTSVWGATFDFAGGAAIYGGASPGIAFQFSFGVKNLSPIDLISLEGTAGIAVNTTSIDRVLAGKTITAGTKQISVDRIDGEFVGFGVSGSLVISIQSNGLKITIPTADPLTLDFFGLASASITGYLEQTGTDVLFSFTGTFEFLIGVEDFLGANFVLIMTLSNASDIVFSADATLTGWLFGYAASLHSTIEARKGGVVKATLEVGPLVIVPAIEICIPFFDCFTTPEVSVHFLETFTVGTIVDNSPPPPDLAHVSNGELILHVGPDAYLRDSAGYLGLYAGQDENFVIDSGSDADGNFVSVTSLGNTQKFYDSIHTIKAVDTGGGDDAILIRSNTGLNATIGGSSGSNRFVYLDSGTATLTGGTGNDILSMRSFPGSGEDRISTGTGTLIGNDGDDSLTGGSGKSTLSGGSGSDNLQGGSGDETLEGGLGRDMIQAGAGNDLIRWTVGDGDDLWVDGGAGTADRLVFIGTDSSDAFSVGEGISQRITSIRPVGAGETWGLTLTAEGVTETYTYTTTSADLANTGAWPYPAGAAPSVGEIAATKLAEKVNTSTLFEATLEGTQGNLIVSHKTPTSDGSGFSVTVKKNAVVQSSSQGGFLAKYNGVSIASPTNVEELQINGQAGADTFNLDALPSTALTSLFVDSGNDTLADAVTINGRSTRPV
ncbi:MAG: calcium-binding protein, partial [Planctomycetota bacterium]|nr:calcium-binding protein [Planctomycetota bacterium]